MPHKNDFVWTMETWTAFQEMMVRLAMSTLTSPFTGEILTIYLAASKEAINLVLIVERDNCGARQLWSATKF